MNRRGNLSKTAKLLLLSASVAFALNTWAQDEQSTATDDDSNAPLDKLVITGSRISRADVEGPSPVTVMTNQDMEREGFTTVFEALNTLTQVYGNTQDDQFSGGFTQNANVIDVRGLGPGRILILINGRRTTDYPLPFNGQSNIVNLNSIPIAAVERVEVLSGGASAIYGSDAVAGVINLVMREDVEDTTFSVRYGDYTQGGGESVRGQIVGGLSGDRGSFTYAVEYFERDPIWASQRDYMDSILDDPDGPPFVNSRVLLALDAFDAFRVGNVGLRYIAPDPSACDAFPELEFSFRPGAGNFCGRDDDISQSTIRNGTENVSAFLNGSYELTDTTELFGYLSYVDKQSEFNTGTLFWQSNRFGPNIDGSNTISNTGNVVQYDLSRFGLGVIDWPQVTLLQRIFTASEMGGRDVNNNQFDEESFDLSAGIRGTLGSTWDYELTVSHSEYDLARERRLIVSEAADTFFAGDSLANLQPDPIFGGFFADLGDLTDPNNRYNRPLTPAEFASISGIDRTTADSSNTTFSLAFTGDIAQMPAGALSFAGVAEWGTQEYDITLDPNLVSGAFWGFTGTGGGGERDRFAAGVEFLVPLHNTLTATVAARWDKYDDITDVDDAVTYSTGLEYRPTRKLLLRGRYSTSFRAPDMHFVFADPSGFFVTLPDYLLCAQDLGIDENSPGGLDSCVDPVRGTLGSSSIQGTRVGNSGLEEEDGESVTLGFVWEIIDGLSISADYYKIELENIVTDRSVNTLLLDERACVLGAPYTVTPGSDCNDVLSRITRNPVDGGINSGTLMSVVTGPFNQAVQETDGIDATLQYTYATRRAGTFSTSLAYSHVLDQKSATLPSDPVLSFRDTGTQDLRSRARGSFGWQYQDFAATLFFNRLGSALTADSLTRNQDLTRIGPQIYWNLSMSYDITDNLRLVAGGDNIFDKEPPLTSEEEYPYFNIFNYDPYGRQVFLQLDYTLD